MTTTLAAVTEPAVRPVPWRRLGWVAWRRYRAALVTTAALLGIAALFVLVRGNQMRHAYALVRACAPSSGASCGFAFAQFQDTYGNVGPIGGFLVFVPGLLGAFAGAPLLARELETGTFRYVWTQGVGRVRWLLALLVPGALGTAAAAAAFGALITWYDQPLLDSGIVQRQHPSIFPLTGVAVAGWALLGYCVGVAAGALIQRAVPAVVATLGVWTGLAFAAAHLRRYDYAAPLVTRELQMPASDEQVGQWWTHGGARVGQAELNHVLQAIGAPTTASGNAVAKPGEPGIDPVHYLLQHGYTQWTSYQPGSRYWDFQAVEAAWLVVLSVLLLGATLWLVRRRSC